MGNAFKESITCSTVKGLLLKVLKFYEENVGCFFKVVTEETLCCEVKFNTIEDYILHSKY